jgi:hypothetical protein
LNDTRCIVGVDLSAAATSSSVANEGHCASTRALIVLPLGLGIWHCKSLSTEREKSEGHLDLSVVVFTARSGESTLLKSMLLN